MKHVPTSYVYPIPKYFRGDKTRALAWKDNFTGEKNSVSTNQNSRISRYCFSVKAVPCTVYIDHNLCIGLIIIIISPTKPTKRQFLLLQLLLFLNFALQCWYGLLDHMWHVPPIKSYNVTCMGKIWPPSRRLTMSFVNAKNSIPWQHRGAGILSICQSESGPCFACIGC